MSKNTDLNCDISSGNCSSIKATDQKTMRTTSRKATSKLKVIYYYDALCGWCYGFNPVISRLEEEYADKIKIETISGGLFTGNRVGYVNEVAPYIRAGAYKNVELITEVKFGEAFLKDVFGDGTMFLDSFPSSVALCIVKEKYPAQALKFSKLLLNAFYEEGLSPIDINDLATCAAKIGVDTKEFLHDMQKNSYKEATQKEFEAFRKSQLGGMPSLVLEKEGERFLLSSGFIKFDVLQDRLEQYL